MVSTCKLSKDGSSTFQDPSLHRSVVRALPYDTTTRPETSYAFNKVCKLMSNSLEPHWLSVKRILRYLNSTINFGLKSYHAHTHPNFSYYKCSVIRIGQQTLMIRGSHQVLPYSLDLMWSLGGQESGLELQGQRLRLITGALLKQLLSFYGFKLF